MMSLFKRMACGWKGHHFYHWRNIYGDEILSCGMNRSMWRCVHCGKFTLRPELHAHTANGAEGQP